MRRKARVDVVEPPAELRTYTPPDTCTQAELWASFAHWKERRWSYGQENGWPGGLLVLLQQNVGIGDRLHGRIPRW